MYQFFFHITPNPMKIAFFLEETGLAYQLNPVDTLKGEQHAPDFVKINPNAKTPALLDNGVRVFDSTAILLYLSEQNNVLSGAAEDRAEILSWMMFIATGVGPYSGQAAHFKNVAPEKFDYAINRYQREVQRHYQVLEDHLAGRDYFVGDSLSIVDVSAWGWIDRVDLPLGEDALDAYPNLQRWFNNINSRPAVARVRKIAEQVKFKAKFDEQAMRALFPQNYSETSTPV